MANLANEMENSALPEQAEGTAVLHRALALLNYFLPATF